MKSISCLGATHIAERWDDKSFREWRDFAAQPENSPEATEAITGVPADQVDAARLELASHETPHSGRIGFEIFDKVSWGESEFDEKVNYQRAM